MLVFLDRTACIVMIAPSSVELYSSQRLTFVTYCCSDNVGWTSFFSRLANSMCFFSQEQRHHTDNCWKVKETLLLGTLNIGLTTSDVCSDGALMYSFLIWSKFVHLMTYSQNCLSCGPLGSHFYGSSPKVSGKVDFSVFSVLSLCSLPLVLCCCSYTTPWHWARGRLWFGVQKVVILGKYYFILCGVWLIRSFWRNWWSCSSTKNDAV